MKQTQSKADIRSGYNQMKDSFCYKQGNRVIVESPAREVCNVYGDGWSSAGDGEVSEDTWNCANLIAYAPDMLEMLKNAEGVVRLTSPSMADKIKELIANAERNQAYLQL